MLSFEADDTNAQIEPIARPSTPIFDTSTTKLSSPPAQLLPIETDTKPPLEIPMANPSMAECGSRSNRVTRSSGANGFFQAARSQVYGTFHASSAQPIPLKALFEELIHKAQIDLRNNKYQAAIQLFAKIPEFRPYIDYDQYKAVLKALAQASFQLILLDNNLQRCEMSCQAIVNFSLVDEENANEFYWELFFEFIRQDKYWWPNLKNISGFDPLSSESFLQCFSVVFSQAIEQLNTSVALYVILRLKHRVANLDEEALQVIYNEFSFLEDYNDINQNIEQHIRKNNFHNLLRLIFQFKKITNRLEYYNFEIQRLNQSLSSITVKLPTETLERDIQEELNQLHDVKMSIQSEANETNLLKLLAFLNKIVPMLFKFDITNPDTDRNYWYIVLLSMFQICKAWFEQQNQSEAETAHSETYVPTSSLSALSHSDFKAGVKDPGHDGDCGYTSFAWGIIVLVLLRQLPESPRIKFYAFMQNYLKLSDPTQEALRNWILKNDLCTLLASLSLVLRKFTVRCLQEDYDANKLGYHKQILAVYQLHQEMIQLRRQISALKQQTQLEQIPPLQERLNKVAEDLSFYQYQHYPEFLPLLDTPGLSEQYICSWWETTAKEIYFQRIATSKQEYFDRDQASGDTRIYADHAQLAKLAEETVLTIIYEDGNSLYCAGRGIIINNLSEFEQALLMSVDVGAMEPCGFCLNPFVDEKALAQRLNNYVDERLESLVLTSYRTIRWPIISLSNENIHWVYILSEANAEQLQTISNELHYLLNGTNKHPTTPRDEQVPTFSETDRVRVFSAASAPDHSSCTVKPPVNRRLDF